MKNKTINIFLLVLFMSIGNVAMSQIEKFKALYIYNICRYVEWPENHGDANFNIGIVGNNSELLSSIKNITAGKKLANKKIKVTKIKDASTATNYNVLYFTRGKEEQISSYEGIAKNSLIIAEKKGSLDQGAAIFFFLENNKLKFDLKVDSATKNGLNISTDLKNLANLTY